MSTASGAPARVPVVVDGRELVLTNLDKPLYPDGTTKAEVVRHYTEVAPLLLPHLRGRPLTRLRLPDGVGGQEFFEKNAPAGTPPWVRTVRLPAPGGRPDRGSIDYVVCDDLPTLVWTANLAALELHVPQWRVDGAGRPQPPDLLVLDLDPGPPATVVECCRVALLLRDHLAAHGLEAVVKTSGSKGLQVYARCRGPLLDDGAPSAYAKALAQQLERAAPDLVVHRMTPSLRTGKVLLDWSQNAPAKTTVAPWSLRARALPTVSTPVTWDEVAACRAPEDLVFTLADARHRTPAYAELLAPLLGDGPAVAGSP